MQDGTGSTLTAMPVKVGRLVVLALAFGLAAFSIICFVVSSAGDTVEAPSADGLNVLLIALGIVGVSVLPLALFLPPRIAARVLKRKEEARAEVKKGLLPREIFAGSLIGAALAEGWGLFGAALYLISGDALTLIAPTIALLVIAMHVPSVEKAQRVFEHAP